MKRIVALILSAVIILLLISACGTRSSNTTKNPPSSSPTENVAPQAEIIPANDIVEEAEPNESEIDDSEIPAISSTAPTSESTPEPKPSSAPLPTPSDTPPPSPEMPPTSAPAFSSALELPESDGMENISITIGGTVFPAKLYNNDTTTAFLELFPMTVEMSELNRNEKYYYLQSSLPASSQKVESITSGDLMLYGSDCLVLFYESFNTSYSYTKLGYIEDVSGLIDVLGHGSVKAEFSVE